MILHVRRFNPQVDAEPVQHAYEVPAERARTVLSCLLHIYEEIDSTLAFRFGCSNVDCGLCAVDVDGKPRLACHTAARDGMVVGPLRGLPVVRDLVVDRAWVLPLVRRLQLFLPSIAWSQPERIVEPAQHRRLTGCTECLGCLSTCPDYDHEDPSRGGPYHFVKLAQYHLDPRNTVDRVSQAASLQVERCRGCRQCYCLVGVPIVKDAILPLATAVRLPQ